MQVQPSKKKRAPWQQGAFFMLKREYLNLKTNKLKKKRTLYSNICLKHKEPSTTAFFLIQPSTALPCHALPFPALPSKAFIEPLATLLSVHY